MANKIKYTELPKLLNGHFQIQGEGKGGKFLLDSDERFHWGAEEKKDYNEATKEIDKIRYKGKGWEVFGWYDVSRFEYWMKEQQEQNYVQITLLVAENIDESEVDKIDDAINNSLAKANGIEGKYNYNPSSEGYEKGGKAGVKNKKSSAGEKVGSYLPVFSGFYNTIFQADEERVIEEPYKVDDYDFDYEKYHKEVAKKCVDVVEGWLKDFNIKVKFEELISPREYNFANDSINVEYELGKDSMKKILSYLEEHKDAFAKYIKDRYTSRSGFMSSYSSDSNEWIADLKDESSLHHKLGAVLEFILQEEGHDEEELYYKVSDYVYLGATLKQEIVDNQEYIQNYAKEHYKNKSQDEVAEDVMNHFNDENIDYSEKTVRKIIKETFSEVEDKSMKMFEKGGKAGAKHGVKKYSDKFEEFYSYGDNSGYARDFGKVQLEARGNDEFEVPLILVAKIFDMYEATGDEQFKEKPIQVSFEISPRPDMIDKKHYESVLESSGLADDYTADDVDVLFPDYIEGYSGGVPLVQDEFVQLFKNESEAKKFIMSKEVNDKLDGIKMMIGFYMDGRINRAGNSRWGYLAHMVDDSKKWMEMYAKGGKISSGLKSFFQSYANDGGLVFGGYFGGGNKMEKGGVSGADFSKETEWMFNILAEASKSGKSDPALDEMLEIAENKDASKANLIKFGELAKKVKDEKLRKEILKTVKNILAGRYKDEFRFSYGGKKSSYRSSTTKEFFSFFSQGYTYGKFEKGGKTEGENKMGIDFQADLADKDLITEDVISHVSDMVEKGNTSGDLHGEKPSYKGWWQVHVEEDENDETERYSEVAKQIRNGNSSGYNPTFTFSANIWND